MTTIRPSPFPQTPLHTGVAQQDAAKHSAQRAFFAAAMGQTQAPAATAAPAAPQAQAPLVRASTAQVEQPQRILRPGSILDIRV